MRLRATAVGMLLFASFAAAQSGPYTLLKEIKIGTDGGWDYLTIDPQGRRLYIGHGTRVAVIDIDKDQNAGEIGDTPGVHGVAVAADLGRVFTTNGQENKVGIVDIRTMKTLSKVDTGGNPDAITYDPKNQEVYSFNGRGLNATVIAARTGAVVATIPLGGKPEAGVVDPSAGRVYVNLEDKNSIAVIDTRTHTVVANWPIAPSEGATGLALDARNHRLFVGCSRIMAVVDSTNGKVIATLPDGSGVDAAVFDPATGYAFTSAGDGTVTVIKGDLSGSRYSVVQTLKTARGARTMALDPKTHNLYLAAVDYQAPAAGSAANARPAAVPGSFKVLVFTMK